VPVGIDIDAVARGGPIATQLPWPWRFRVWLAGCIRVFAANLAGRVVGCNLTWKADRAEPPGPDADYLRYEARISFEDVQTLEHMAHLQSAPSRDAALRNLLRGVRDKWARKGDTDEVVTGS
jgi:hypothetical protein